MVEAIINKFKQSRVAVSRKKKNQHGWGFHGTSREPNWI